MEGRRHGRAYCGGVAPEPLPPFLVLTQEKEAKESQGLTEAGEVWPGRGAPPKRPGTGRIRVSAFGPWARLVGVCDTPLPRYVHHLQERAQGLDVFLGGAAFEATVEVVAG